MKGKSPTEWQPEAKKRSRGWRHSLRVSLAQANAKPRSRSPDVEKRSGNRTKRTTPSLPPTPWKD